jgi:hypothetical protein
MDQSYPAKESGLCPSTFTWRLPLPLCSSQRRWSKADAAPAHVLTISKTGGAAVRKGDVLFASLAPKTVVVVTEPGQKLTCKSATVSAKVVSNPSAPGKATESVTKETLSKCTVSVKGVTVKSVTALNLPYVATVSDSKGNPVKVSGRSKSKPMGFTATVKFGTTTITCSSSAATVTGHASNKGNTISFSKQTFKKLKGGPLCPKSGAFSATYGPLTDTSVKGHPKVFVN